MEENVNVENEQPEVAPKVEKISLAELRAEAQKLSEFENKYIQEQKEFDEYLKNKKQKKEQKLKEEQQQSDEQFEKELEIFINSVNAFSPEEQKEFVNLLDDAVKNFNPTDKK